MNNIDGQQLFAMVQRIIKASKPYIGAQDGSYEASLYYHSCEEVKRLKNSQNYDKTCLISDSKESTHG